MTTFKKMLPGRNSRNAPPAALAAVALLLCLPAASGPILAQGRAEMEARRGSILARDAGEALDGLTAAPDSKAAIEKFLAVFQRAARRDPSQAAPGDYTVLIDTYAKARELSLEGRPEFLRSFMMAAIGPYGDTAEGEEWLNEILWENLQMDPHASLAMLAEFDTSDQARLMETVYTAPIHDGFDFRGILERLRDVDPLMGMDKEARGIRVTCWEASTRFRYDRHLGSAVPLDAEQACLSIPAGDIPAGVSVRLIDPWSGRALSAAIEKVTRGFCLLSPSSRIPLGDPEDAHYVARFTEGVPNPPDIYIALVAGPADLDKGEEDLRADLDRKEPDESFRACTSTEGMHLAVWSGEPLAGERRWHRYQPLGFEVEPWEGSCAEGDYPPSPSPSP